MLELDKISLMQISAVRTCKKKKNKKQQSIKNLLLAHSRCAEAMDTFTNYSVA